ncbi:MAG: glycosyltransferase family 2 protein [Candidatus Saccharibacteria bacterium]
MASPTILEAINAQSNDYSDVEARYHSDTHRELTDLGPTELIDLHESPCSVVISAYKGERTLPFMIDRLNQQTARDFEVIIVDDCSPQPLLSTIVAAEPNFPTKYIRVLENQGRAHTANVGLMAAEGECLIFTDQDILFDRDFVKRFSIKHAYTSDCVFLGFKDEIEFDDIPLATQPDGTSDWRNQITAESNFIALGANSGDTPEARTYRILDETYGLKQLGHGRTIGFWDLASTAISHGISLKRELARQVGGVPEQGFKGWGGQDIAFGAKLIAAGSYLVPAIDTAYHHVSHERYSGNRETELQELRRNLVSYHGLLGTTLDQHSLNEERVRNRGQIGLISIMEV